MFYLGLILSLSFLAMAMSASKTETVIVLMGGSYLLNDTFYATNIIEYYYLTKPYKNHISFWRMRHNRSGLFALQFTPDNATIIYGGGTDMDIPVNREKRGLRAFASTEFFNPHINEPGRDGPSLIKRRFLPSAAVINGQLFVSSGVDGRIVLKSSEIYKSGKFVGVPDMPLNVTPHTESIRIAQYEGRIFAFDLKNKLIYIYDLGSPKKWIKTKPSSSTNPNRTLHAVATLEDHIYICGGNDIETLKSCERYNPANNRWESVAGMNVARTGFVLIPDLTTRRLYAMGGANLACKTKKFNHDSGKQYRHSTNVTDTVEYFDLDTGRWHMTQNLKMARALLAAVLVNF